MRAVLLLALGMGCAEEPEKVEEGIEITGSVSLIDRAGEADVDGTRAFGYNTDGRMGVLVSSNPDATCAGVAELLAGDGTVDPSDIYSPGTCYLWLSVSDYDGSWSHSYVESDEGYSKAVSSNLNCAMGSGEFELVDTVNGPGFQWTGDWWVGSPTAYELDFSGGDGEDFEIDVRMTRYQGAMPLTLELTSVLAEGEISGGGVAEWCEAMGAAAVF
jgi:hypothetical protein